MTEQFQSTSTDTGRSKARTSAAMIGLAISVGATNLLLPRQGESVMAAEPPAAAANQQPEVALRTHVVQPGDTLADIAITYSTSLEALLAVNGIQDAETEILQVGQTLKVPGKPSNSDKLAAIATDQPGGEDSAFASKPTTIEKVNPKPSISLLDEKGVLNGERPIGTLGQLEAQVKGTSTLETPAVVRTQSPRNIAVTDASEGQAATALEVATPQSVPEASALVAAAPMAEIKEEAAAVVQEFSADEEAVDPGVSLPWVEGEGLGSGDALAMAEPTVAPVARHYQVQAGDTLGHVARRYGVSLQSLIRANSLDNPHMIRAGQVLVVPPMVGTDLAVYANGASSAVTSSSAAAPTAAGVSAIPASPGAEVVSSPTASVSPAPREATTGKRTTQNAYIAGLQAEIRALQQKYEGRLSSVLRYGPAALEAGAEGKASVRLEDDAPVSDAPVVNAPVSDAPVGSSLVDDSKAATLVEPSNAEETQPSSLGALPPLHGPTDAEAQVSEPEQLALASPTLDDRNPTVRSLLGQTVSPSLPPLASADAYLPDSMSFNGYIWPTKGVFTSGYGWRWGRMHKGIDIAAPIGTPIVAAADGEVVFSGWNSGGYGNLVDIRHADGSLTRYAHNSRNLVKRGQKVRQGQLIAEMGSTGRSTGPHLHFEIRRPGKGAINPKAMLPKGGLRAAR
ncbi:MAG: peptidoglycan DD-metalloendopeptidase family protein [Cyanobacteria bacterium P01_H01_bin.130]